MSISYNVNLPEVSGNYLNSKIIRTPDDVFYTGMTLEDARLIKRDKSFLLRDFKNIDKNKDGILTNDEIISERKRESWIYTWKAIAMACFALTSIRTTIKNPSLTEGLFATLFTIFTADSVILRNKIAKTNKELENELKIQA